MVSVTKNGQEVPIESTGETTDFIYVQQTSHPTEPGYFEQTLYSTEPLSNNIHLTTTVEPILESHQINPSDVVSVIKNGQEVSDFFNNEYCGSGSYHKALQVNSEYKINGAEAIKILFRSDSSATYSGYLIELRLTMNEISTYD